MSSAYADLAGPPRFVDVDADGQISLAGIGRHDRYWARTESNGTVILVPAHDPERRS